MCVCALYVYVKKEVVRFGGWAKKHTNNQDLLVKPQLRHRPSPIFYSLFTFLCLDFTPAAHFTPPSLCFNCRDQQTYGQWSVARKCYIFVQARPDVLTVPQPCQMRGCRGKYSQLKPNTVMLNSLFLSVALSFPPPVLSSSLIKTWAVFSSITPCPAEVSFHVLPRPVVCQAAQCQATVSLPTHPPSCRLLNNAIHCSPLTRPASFSFIATPPGRHAMQLKPLVDYIPQ